MFISIENLPTEKECYKLLEEYDVPENIISHSVKVRDVCQFLLEHLHPSCSVNRELVLSAALLHDIMKMESIKKNTRHDEVGEELLRSLGYYEIADVVGQHVDMKDFNLHTPLTEVELVYYADKRVRHDEFVSVEDRIIDLLERYGLNENSRKHIMHMKDVVIEIEIKLERCLNSSIDEIFALYE